MERVSVARYVLVVVHPVSDMFLNQQRLAVAIKRLCSRVVGQSHFFGAIQVVGISISVGIKIFNIAGG